MTFEKWFLSSPHRAKYDSASPAYLAARESWQAGQREALLGAAEQMESYCGPTVYYELHRMAKELE